MIPSAGIVHPVCFKLAVSQLQAPGRLGNRKLIDLLQLPVVYLLARRAILAAV